MRTTVSIDDQLLTAAKQRAREQRQTIGEVIEGALRRELAVTPPPSTVDVPVFAGRGGLRPGVDPTSNRALLESLDDDQPLDALR